MATDKAAVTNIDLSDLVNYPNGRIKDDTGTGNGTPVNRLVYSDLHEFFAKLMRLAKITYNTLPENEGNGYQLVQALQAFANKNDLLATLSSVSGELQVATIKLSTLVLNEIIYCKAAVDYATETEVAGSETGVTLAVSVSSAYKANDYLKLIKTSVGITIIRMITADNLSVVALALGFLKAATNAQTITGIATNVAVTPAALLAAFTDWVNGTDSASYLVTHSVNGLMSAADKILLDGLNNPVKNVGWFSGVDIGAGTVGSFAPVHGDIVSAQLQSVNPGTGGSGAESVYLITIANAMANTSYFVKSHLQSEGTLIIDNNVRCPAFRPQSVTQFLWSASESPGEAGAESLKIHLEVQQY